MKINQWDYQLIRICKSNHPDPITLFRTVVAERCELEMQYVSVEDVADELLRLAQHLNLLSGCNLIDFIHNLDPKNNWKFLCRRRDYLSKDTTAYEVILLSRLDSLFRLTEVKDINGWEAFNDYDRNPYLIID